MIHRIVSRVFKTRDLAKRSPENNHTLEPFFSYRTASIFLIAFLAIYLCFRFFHIDWGLVAGTLKSLNIWNYLAALIAYYFSFIFRGIRWRLIARNASELDDYELNDLKGNTPLLEGFTNFRSTILVLCGWFVNSLIWLRLGDAYRAYCLGIVSKLGFPWALGTLVAERVLDMAIVFVAILFSFMMLSTGIHSQAIQILIICSTIITFLLLSFVLLLLYGEDWVMSLIPTPVRPYYQKFKMGVLKSFKNIVVICGLGLLAWLMEVTRMFFVTEALNIEIPIYLIILASMSNAVLSTFPTPGGIGFVESGLTGILLIFVASSDAAAVTLLDRSITYISILVLGGLAFLFHYIWFGRELNSKSATVSS